jgi:hypothetical protein
VGVRPSAAPPAFAPCISAWTPTLRTQACAVPCRSNCPDLSAPPCYINHAIAPGPGVAPRRVPRAAAADHPRPAPGNAMLVDNVCTDNWLKREISMTVFL